MRDYGKVYTGVFQASYHKKVNQLSIFQGSALRSR